MPTITITDLNNAKLDADHMARVATSTAPTSTNRVGGVVPTISAAVESLMAPAVELATYQNKLATDEAREEAVSAATVATTVVNVKATIAAGVAASTGTGYVFTVYQGGADGLGRTTTFEMRSGVPVPVIDPVSGAEFDLQFRRMAPESGYLGGFFDTANRMVFGIPLTGWPIETRVTQAVLADMALAVNDARAKYVVVPKVDGSSNGQLVSFRKRDGKRTNLTTTGNNVLPHLQGDGAVLYTADGVGRWISVEGGTGGLLLPQNPIGCWGDSLSADTYEPSLVGRLGTPVLSLGIGGQTSTEIVARQGSKPSLLTVASNTIPASGAVSVSAWSVDLLIPRGAESTTMTLAGSLAGVPGTLTRTGPSTAYAFSRTTSGSAVACPAGTPFLSDRGQETRAYADILWMGTNDVIYGGTVAGLQDNIRVAVAFNTCYVKRQLVIGPLNRADQPKGRAAYQMVRDMEDSVAANADAQGYSFLNVRRFLIDNRAGVAAAIGVTLTSQDNTDAANDLIPTSFRQDSTHPTTAVYNYIGGTLIYNHINNLGWIGAL